MKKLTILLLCAALASCGSKSGQREPVSNDRTTFFRAQRTWVSTVTFDRYVDIKVEIISADSAYKAGDTIMVDDLDYIIRERVK